jgi:hypothetical protein
MRINLNILFLTVFFSIASIREVEASKKFVMQYFYSHKKNKHSDKKVKDLKRRKRRQVYRTLGVPTFSFLTKFKIARRNVSIY